MKDLDKHGPFTLERGKGNTPVVKTPSGERITTEEFQRRLEKSGVRHIATTVSTETSPVRVDFGLDEDLENFLLVKHSLLFIMRGKNNLSDDMNTEMGDLNSCWSALEDAKIFSCQKTFLGALEHSFNYLEKLTGKKYRAEDNLEVYKDNCSELEKLAKAIPYPNNLPFPNTYLSFGRGVIATAKGDMHLMGILISEKAAWQFTFMDAAGIAPPLVHFQKGQWTTLARFSPWVITQLIDLINSYKSYVEEVPRTLKQKLHYDKAAKRFGLSRGVPPPYYRVKLQDSHIKERAHAMFPTNRKLSYRHERRKHECCRFMRGKLPIDPQLEQEFIKKGYQVYKDNPVDVNTFRRLSIRGLPNKEQDEWLAVKTYWIKHCMVGDSSLPYRPSIHEV